MVEDTFLRGFQVRLRTYAQGSVVGNVHACGEVTAFEESSLYAISSFQQIYVISGASCCYHQAILGLALVIALMVIA